MPLLDSLAHPLDPVWLPYNRFLGSHGGEYEDGCLLILRLFTDCLPPSDIIFFSVMDTVMISQLSLNTQRIPAVANSSEGNQV
jgi:hypothetical protein